MASLPSNSVSECIRLPGGLSSALAPLAKQSRSPQEATRFGGRDTTPKKGKRRIASVKAAVNGIRPKMRAKSIHGTTAGSDPAKNRQSASHAKGVSAKQQARAVLTTAESRRRMNLGYAACPASEQKNNRYPYPVASVCQHLAARRGAKQRSAPDAGISLRLQRESSMVKSCPIARKAESLG